MPKHFVVIGGTSGIGERVVKKLALDDSNRITLVSREPPPEEMKENAVWNSVDVCHPTPSFPEVEGPLDGLVYAVGNIHLKPFESFKDQDFLNDWQINVGGAIKAIRFYLPNLKLAARSSVVAFSSVAVCQGMNYHASTACAKGALEGLFRALAAEYSPHIRFNLIAPSLTNTPLAQPFLNTDVKREISAKRHPLQRIGTPKEIAGLACFLLSEEGSWITGQVFHVDGGLSTLKLF
jgi:NAD(P)-dependent dehydrogenase (short-subunit alcohol dehydrogenase family)